MKPHSLIEKQQSLDFLTAQIRVCEKCSLSATRKHALPGEGNINATIFFVALSPGVKEDSENQMFIGPSGKVLNRLLQSAGIKRESVYMTNLVKCLLPKNRKPNWKEIDACSTYLDEEIQIIQPEIIVPLGYYATRSILKKYHFDSPNAKMTFKNWNGQLLRAGEIKIFPLTHPSALLYNPSFEPGTSDKYKKLKSLL